jgi:hypothetical protein
MADCSIRMATAGATVRDGGLDMYNLIICFPRQVEQVKYILRMKAVVR